ncbi:MAG: type VI secretion system baseplate subunit TssF [Phycisphaeraceae bacterium]|nr:type VI secretion system baseplate subunit TssF [Phycisphaeraceae bacterium]
MDRRLIRYYDRELRHLQTVAKEFAREFPKIAGRLALEDFPCVDPYVERLLEGSAFLAARVQLKLDAEFPRFTQNLLETVYPHYLAPTPSMCVVRFQPDRGEAGLADGYQIPRGTTLRSAPSKDVASCEYRTAHDLSLWPVEIVETRYYTRDAGALDLATDWNAGRDAPQRHPQLAAPGAVRAALRIRLRTTAGLTWNKVAMRDLILYLRGGDATPARLYEALFAHARAVVIRPVPVGLKRGNWQHTASPDGRPMAIHQVGFSAQEALIPYDDRSFQGYRLLHEYFAFPQRFLFAKISDVSGALRRCDGDMIDVIIPLSQENPELEGAVENDNIALHCTPAINVFPKRADRIFVSDSANEFQIIPDRTRPLDYEVYRVGRVTGFTTGGEERVFRPFYSATDADGDDMREAGAYFATHRVPRALSDRERRQGPRASYTGSEVYVSIVDASAAPYSTDIRQLAVETLCTNRDLPLQMPVGKSKTDFTLDVGAPVEHVRVVTGPTPPRPSHAEGDTSWRLISHLTLNYLSITDDRHDPQDTSDALTQRLGSAALRDLLKLYGDIGDPAIRKQIEGVRAVSAEPITRRLPSPGAVAFGRGLQVTVTLEESMFEGLGVFILGAVLDQFFARYVSINSFTETAVRTTERGEIMRWSARVGHRPLL